MICTSFLVKRHCYFQSYYAKNVIKTILIFTVPVVAAATHGFMAIIYYCMHWFQINNFTHYKNVTKSNKNKSHIEISQLQTFKGFNKIYDIWLSLPTSSCYWNNMSLGHNVGLSPKLHNLCSIASLSLRKKKGIMVATTNCKINVSWICYQC
jgi:hypothetical protein